MAVLYYKFQISCFLHLTNENFHLSPPCFSTSFNYFKTNLFDSNLNLLVEKHGGDE